MSTGAALLLVPETNGATRRLFLYYSADRVTWTLKATITPTAALVANTIFTMCLDGTDNMHLAWKDSAGNIKYILSTFTNPGGVPTWTAGSEETVGAVGGKVYKYIDMDVVSGTVAFVGVVNYTDAVMRSWVRRSSDNTWVQLTDASITTFGAASLPSQGGFTCARDAGGLSGSNAKVAYIARTRDASGEQIRIKTFNATTGAEVSDTAMASGAFANNNTYRDYFLFSKGSNEWVALVLIGQSTVSRPWAARFSSTAYLNGWTGGPILTLTRSGLNSSVTAGFVGDAGNVIYKSGNDWYNVPVVFDAAVTPNAIRWSTQLYWQETDGVGGTRIFSGNNRNFGSRKIDTFDWRSGTNLVKSWYNQTPTVPTLVDPGSGVTVTSDFVTLTTRMKNATARPQTKMKGKWLVARDAAFTLNLQTVLDPATDYAVVGTTPVVTSEKTPELFQGTWYARAIQVTEFGVESSPSGTTTDHTFVISHPPVNLPISPSGDAYYAYGASGQLFYTWQFTDPSPTDYETAHQIVVELNDNSGTVVLDTGKVTDVAPFIVSGGNEGDYASLAATYKDTPLKWYVKTWDSDDVAGAFSDALPFRIGDAPTVAITSPANDGDTVTVPAPTITWTFSAAGGRTQVARRVVFYQGTTVIYDSTFQNDAGTSFTLPSALLTNGGVYSVSVTARDSGGLETTASRTFNVTFTPPAAPSFTLDPSSYQSLGYLQITWTNAAQDANFNSWRVYRRKTGTSNWVLAAEYTDALASYTYQDWLLPSNNQYDYAVVQTAVVFGTIVESAYNATSVTTNSEDYWLIHPTDNSLNVRLNIVTADAFSEEYEQNTLNLIGRGRKTDYGTRWGYTGSLTALLRDSTVYGFTARSQRLKLETLKAQKVQLYLRNPFGDIWTVTASDISVTRIPGTGQNEVTDVTVPYQEVAT
jgi:hypothetical protein